MTTNYDSWMHQKLPKTVGHIIIQHQMSSGLLISSTYHEANICSNKIVKHDHQKSLGWKTDPIPLEKFYINIFGINRILHHTFLLMFRGWNRVHLLQRQLMSGTPQPFRPSRERSRLPDIDQPRPCACQLKSTTISGPNSAEGLSSFSWPKASHNIQGANPGRNKIKKPQQFLYEFLSNCLPFTKGLPLAACVPTSWTSKPKIFGQKCIDETLLWCMQTLYIINTIIHHHTSLHSLQLYVQVFCCWLFVETKPTPHGPNGYLDHNLRRVMKPQNIQHFETPIVQNIGEHNSGTNNCTPLSINFPKQSQGYRTNFAAHRLASKEFLYIEWSRMCIF